MGEDNWKWEDNTHREYFTVKIQQPIKFSVQGVWSVDWMCVLNCEKGNVNPEHGVVASLSSQGSVLRWTNIPIVDKAVSAAGKHVFTFLISAVFQADKKVEVPYIRLDLTVNWNWLENAVNVFDFFYQGFIDKTHLLTIPPIQSSLGDLDEKPVQLLQEIPPLVGRVLAHDSEVSTSQGCLPFKFKIFKGIKRKLSPKKPE